MKNLNCYEEYMVQKGYTLAEIRQAPLVADKRVPANLRDHYDTYEQYQEAIYDFLNGNWFPPHNQLQQTTMSITFTDTYRDILTAPTLELIDRLEDECDLGCMLKFIDENTEEQFQEYYEQYVELGEATGYEAVDAFIKQNDISDLDHFVDAYLGEYDSPYCMAQDYFAGETDRLDYRISIDWEDTAAYLLDHDVDRVGDFYFRCSY